MARKPRVHYPGALYHVMVRGNNGEDIFKEEGHKRKYLDTLASYKDKMGFIIYAYCIMDNHAHMLIEVTDIPLSKSMQGIQQVYTGWYNRKYERTGHVFQQRYKALLCDKENYLLQVLKYIHNNPVKAKLKEGIDYKWSSHKCYMWRQNNSIVDWSYALSMFSEDINKAKNLYLNFMDQEEKEISYMDINGSKSTNKSKYKNDNGLIVETSIDEIMEEISVNENKTVGEIIKKTKIQEITDIRKAIIYISDKYCSISNSILAEKLNLSPSMISKIRSGENKMTTNVEDIINRWERKSK